MAKIKRTYVNPDYMPSLREHLIGWANEGDKLYEKLKAYAIKYFPKTNVYTNGSPK